MNTELGNLRIFESYVSKMQDSARKKEYEKIQEDGRGREVEDLWQAVSTSVLEAYAMVGLASGTSVLGTFQRSLLGRKQQLTLSVSHEGNLGHS